MSAAAIIAIAVGIVVVLGALSFVTLARRSDVRGAGALSAETRERDREAREDQSQEAVVAAADDAPRSRHRARSPATAPCSHRWRRQRSLPGRLPTRRRWRSAAGSS